MIQQPETCKDNELAAHCALLTTTVSSTCEHSIAILWLQIGELGQLSLCVPMIPVRLLLAVSTEH
jgi:hypothetical protein